jgi:KDO2-lipid IV(A) lauroyltransferase
MEVLPHSGGAAFGTLARRLRAGGLVCLVADRDLSASGVAVDFFGETARMPAGPALLAQQTGALLLPVTLWYDDSPVMRGRVHPPIEVPESGTRTEKTSVMTQALADAFASGIADHPEDWHMLQRLWLADLEPRRSPADGEGPGTGRSAPAATDGADGAVPAAGEPS